MRRLPGRSIRDSYRIRVSRREHLARAREHSKEIWPAPGAGNDNPQPVLIPPTAPRPPHRPGGRPRNGSRYAAPKRCLVPARG